MYTQNHRAHLNENHSAGLSLHTGDFWKLIELSRIIQDKPMCTSALSYNKPEVWIGQER